MDSRIHGFTSRAHGFMGSWVHGFKDLSKGLAESLQWRRLSMLYLWTRDEGT